jgi:hypothetical protein
MSKGERAHNADSLLHIYSANCTRDRQMSHNLCDDERRFVASLFNARTRSITASQRRA